MNYERSIYSAAVNEYNIIRKLYIQSTRPSPFQLTDEYARTANLWEQITKGTYKNVKRNQVVSSYEEKISYDYQTEPIQSPNQSQSIPEQDISELMDGNDTEIVTKINDSPTHADNINETEDKHVAPIVPHTSSIDNKVSYMSKVKINKRRSQHLTDPINDGDLKYTPDTLIFTENNTKEKVFKIRVLNISTESRYVQFKDVSDSTSFQYIHLCPMVLTKIYPGMSALFKLKIRLKRNVENISSGLWFRVFTNAIKDHHNTMFVPIVSDFVKKHCIIITEKVYIPPVYTWELKSKYGNPKGVLNIKVKGDYQYEVCIRKQPFNVINENLIIYKKIEIKNTENEIEMLENDTSEFDDVVKQSVEDVENILDTIISQALEIFVIYESFLRVSHNSQIDVAIYFTKAHCPGFYQSMYNVEFYDFETKELIVTKHVKVYAELLRHPIQLRPIILDMSSVGISLGYCKGQFTLRNCHKRLTFKVRIEITKKMKQLLKITPAEASVCANSEVFFNILACIPIDSAASMNERAFFTIQVNIKSKDQTFREISPVFYEVIMPCSKEFKAIYNLDVNDDVPTDSRDE